MALRSCSVSFVGPSGVRHCVTVTAESLYEAAILGVAALRTSGWADTLASGTQIEVEVREPATTHCVTIAQLRRWCEGVCASPDETLRKQKLRKLLA